MNIPEPNALAQLMLHDALYADIRVYPSEGRPCLTVRVGLDEAPRGTLEIRVAIAFRALFSELEHMAEGGTYD
jgi:hypothetical protein